MQRTALSVQKSLAGFLADLDLATDSDLQLGLIAWVRRHKAWIGSDEIEESGLLQLIETDQPTSPNCPEEPVGSRVKRLTSGDRKSIRSLLQTIRTELEDIMLLRTGEDCPACEDGELVVWKMKRGGLIGLCSHCDWSGHDSSARPLQLGVPSMGELEDAGFSVCHTPHQ